MKLKLVTTSDKTDHPGWHKLRVSLEKHGWDYEHILHPFMFGHQLPIVRDWCHKYSGDATHIAYVDAFDNIAFSGMEEVINKFTLFDCKMLISAEKNAYPHPERAGEYPPCDTPWKYVNGGGWMVAIDYFKELCQKEGLNDSSHDQVWLMDAFLRNRGEIKIDYNCEIFQTIAFSNREEWAKKSDGRIVNIGTITEPIFFHGNGHTEMDWLW